MPQLPFGDALSRIPHAHVVALAVAIFLVLLLVRRVPWLRTLLSVGLTTALVMLLLATVRRQAAFDPALGSITRRLGIDEQRVVGRETRVKVSPDGHFWVRARIDGVPRRMLIDSGATVTALSPRAATAAGIEPDTGALPVILRTANGTVAAQTGRIGELRLGNIVARDLAVVVSPGLGDTDVLGMNFLSRLKSWRVEGGTLILSPNHPVAAAATDAGEKIAGD